VHGGHERENGTRCDIGTGVTAPPADSVDRSMSLALTGPFATSELPRLGIDPVTVTVSRDIAAGHEAEFEAWAADVERALEEFPGCLGVGVLKAGATGGCYHVVFRFTDLVALRRWERSPERIALLARLDEHVVATRVQRTVGVDHWFEAPARVERHRPWWRRWLGDSLWITPMALVVTFVVSPHLVFIPVVARVVVTTLATTAFVGFALMPARRRLRARLHPV
jgi:antibiotic biosynthesis monooxygenase (ABM) superfamily enzyme